MFSNVMKLKRLPHTAFSQPAIPLLMSIKGYEPASQLTDPLTPSFSLFLLHTPTIPQPPQVRLLDGSAITQVFKAQEPLAAVRVYVQMNSNTPEGQDFTLLSPYPRQVYTELDMEKPLKELGEHAVTGEVSAL